jgi:UDP-N-acetyl-2-amino-2-deoxyglucuronate dehydrogenase
MKKFKIALVGCGRISKNHFESIKFLKNECELTAVCDCIPERAEEAGKQWNAKVFTDYDKMLAEVDCELVTKWA